MTKLNPLETIKAVSHQLHLVAGAVQHTDVTMFSTWADAGYAIYPWAIIVSIAIGLLSYITKFVNWLLGKNTPK